MKNLVGKGILVMGGSRGIGAAIVKKFAEEGAQVAFTYNQSEQKAAALAEEVVALGGKALAIKADSASSEAVIQAVDQAVAAFGRVDVLVNNAGIYIGKAFEEHTLEEYDEIMAINVRAAYVAANAVVKQMVTGGRIISIGSNMADNAVSAQTTLYTMSKSALQGFTRGLARDLGPKQITVNLVQPGPIDTDMNPANTDFANGMKTRIALTEYGTVEDISGLVSFLASEEGKYITGSIITIDGGFNA